MAYGDSGFSVPKGAPANSPKSPCTEGEVVGKDSTGKEVVRSKKFLIDSGATRSAIDRENLKGMSVEYKGALVSQTASGTVAVDIFSGVTFKFQATNANGQKVDLLCKEPFVLLNLALLGGDQLKATGVTVTIDYKAETVSIKGEKQ